MTANQVRLLIALTRKIVEDAGGRESSDDMRVLSELADAVRDEHNEYVTALNEFDKMLMKA